MVPFLAVLCAPPLCSAPLRALDVVTQQRPGLSEIAFIHALLRQSMTRSARRYHGPYLVVAQYCNEQTIIGFAPIYDGHAQTRRGGSPCRSRSRSLRRRETRFALRRFRRRYTTAKGGIPASDRSRFVRTDKVVDQTEKRTVVAWKPARRAERRSGRKSARSARKR
jgi:hypothetical protein